VQGVYVRATCFEQHGRDGGIDAAGQADYDALSCQIYTIFVHGAGNSSTDPTGRDPSE
jgi:hypothetical protein